MHGTVTYHQWKTEGQVSTELACTEWRGMLSLVVGSIVWVDGRSALRILQLAVVPLVNACDSRALLRLCCVKSIM